MLILVFLVASLYFPAICWADQSTPITFNFQNFDVKEALTICASMAGVHLEVDPKITGKLTKSFQAVPFTEAILRITKQFDLKYIWDGPILRVFPSNTTTQTANFPTQSGQLTQSPQTNIPQLQFDTSSYFTGNQTPYLVKIKYLKADAVKTAIGAIIPEDRVRTEPTTNALILVISEEDYQRVIPLINAMDIPPKQVLFEAEVVEISKTDSKNLGINWEWTTYPAPSNASSTDGGSYVGVIPIRPKSDYNLNYKSTISALVSVDKARILAKPHVTALDGQTARILIGDKLPVETKQYVNGYLSTTVTYIDVGIKLEVTPRANENEILTIEIRPEVSTNIAPAGANPSIRTREAQTTVRVQTGDTIILGGLIQYEDRKKISKIPFFGDLPLLGRFFLSDTNEKRETELVIFITPRLVDTLKKT